MEEAIEANPNMEHAQWRFQLGLSDELVPNKAELKQKLLAAVEADSMCSLFNFLLFISICTWAQLLFLITHTLYFWCSNNVNDL